MNYYLIAAIMFAALSGWFAFKMDKLSEDLRNEKEFTQRVYNEKVRFEGLYKNAASNLRVKKEDLEVSINGNREKYKQIESLQNHIESLRQRNIDLQRQLTDIVR